MQVASAQDSRTLAQAIARLYKSHRFLCAIEVLGRTHVFASDVTATDALIEARAEYPKGQVVGQWEYLPKAAIQALREAITRDPVAQTLHRV